ncbi:hypothetical protein ACFWA9_16430 [Kitasatospora sp. NPDC059973]|uniref:hypothetical protein n=1 Tax=Kitasatospora sp. NPDC059973 TaxID=3347020 RepID=UPI0036ACE89D
MAILGQSNWRYCGKCFGLWFNGNPTNGVCPAGGAHTSSGSFDYLLPANNFSGIAPAGAGKEAATEDDDGA